MSVDAEAGETRSNVDSDTESEGTGYETAPEIVEVLCGTYENVAEADTNDVINDSDLENCETASEGVDSSGVSENQAVDVTCDGKSEFEIRETEDTSIVHERVFQSYPVDMLNSYLEDCNKMQNTIPVEMDSRLRKTGFERPEFDSHTEQTDISPCKSEPSAAKERRDRPTDECLTGSSNDALVKNDIPPLKCDSGGLEPASKDTSTKIKKRGRKRRSFRKRIMRFFCCFVSGKEN